MSKYTVFLGVCELTSRCAPHSHDGSDGESCPLHSRRSVSPPLPRARTHTKGISDSTLVAASNPSCFFDSLSTLPTSSPCESVARSDSLRITLATRMTLCELKTAGPDGGREGLIPRECSDWERSNGKGKVGGCVEALARSPQYWSSYSGYLREVGESSVKEWGGITDDP